MLGFRDVGEDRAAAARDEKVDAHRVERRCEAEQQAEVLVAGPAAERQDEGSVETGPGRQGGAGRVPEERVFVPVRQHRDVALGDREVGGDLLRGVARHGGDPRRARGQQRKQRAINGAEGAAVALRAAEHVGVVDAHDLVGAGGGCRIAQVEKATRPAQRQHGLLPDMAGARAERPVVERGEARHRGPGRGQQRGGQAVARQRGIERAGDIAGVALHAGDRLTEETAVDGEGRRSHARDSRSAAARMGEAPRAGAARRATRATPVLARPARK